MEVSHKNLHHANLLIGSREKGELYVRSLLGDLGVELKNNPDFLVLRTETFGIDEARELKALSIRKAINGIKVFLIMPIRMTLEAQNALLKTFEDPTPDTYFFLVLREEAVVIPTLRSRMELTYLPDEETIEKEAQNFLSFSQKERLLFAERFAVDKKNLSSFLDSLLLLVRKSEGRGKSLEKIYEIRRVVSDSTSNSRMILEHLALVL